MCEWGDTLPVQIDGIFQSIDRCIAPIVVALNAAGVPTIACCCGHGHRPGNIALTDGRELVIARNFDEAREIDDLFPLNIGGENRWDQ